MHVATRFYLRTQCFLCVDRGRPGSSLPYSHVRQDGLHMRWRRERNSEWWRRKAAHFSRPPKCLANTLLCMKRKIYVLFYKDVNSDILTFTKLVNCNKFFWIWKKVDVCDNIKMFNILCETTLNTRIILYIICIFLV